LLVFGVKCDKFVTKSQAPTTPYGVPPYFVILRETQSPEKISMQQCFTRIGGIYLEGAWLRRISGSYSFRDFYRSIWNFLSQPR